MMFFATFIISQVDFQSVPSPSLVATVTRVEKILGADLGPIGNLRKRQLPAGQCMYADTFRNIVCQNSTGAVTLYKNYDAMRKRMYGELPGKTLSKERVFWQSRGLATINKLWPSLKELVPFKFTMYGTEGDKPGRYSSQNRLVSVGFRQKKNAITVYIAMDEVKGKVESFQIDCKDRKLIPRIGM